MLHALAVSVSARLVLSRALGKVLYDIGSGFASGLLVAVTAASTSGRFAGLHRIPPVNQEVGLVRSSGLIRDLDLGLGCSIAGAWVQREQTRRFDSKFEGPVY